MTREFWLLYGIAVIALLLIGMLAGWAYEHGKAWYRRWLIRIEIAEMKERQRLDAAAKLGRRLM